MDTFWWRVAQAEHITFPLRFLVSLSRLDGLETPFGNVSVELGLTELPPHPERGGGAGERSGRGEDRVQPAKLPMAYDQNDDGGVDAEWKPEEDRRFQRGQDSHTTGRQEGSE